MAMTMVTPKDKILVRRIWSRSDEVFTNGVSPDNDSCDDAGLTIVIDNQGAVSRVSYVARARDPSEDTEQSG